MALIDAVNLNQCNHTYWNNDSLDYEDATIHITAQCGIINTMLSNDNYNNINLLKISENGSKIAKASVLLRKIHAPYSNLLIREGLKSIASLFKYITWTHGPVISEARYRTDVLDCFLDWVDKYAKQSRAFSVEGATLPFYFNNYESELDHIFKKYNYFRLPGATVALNLNKFKTSEDCWNNIKRESRVKVKKAIKDGIEIIEDNNLKYLSEYIRLQRDSKHPSRPYYRNERFFRQIAGIYNSGNMCKLFVACKDGQVLSGQALFIFNKIIILEGVVISETARKNNWYANDLMQWHIIKWAKKRGYRLIDWGGFSLFPTEKEKNINYFKLKWGGAVYRYYAYSKIFIPWKYKLIKNLRKVKKAQLS